MDARRGFISGISLFFVVTAGFAGEIELNGVRMKPDSTGVDLSSLKYQPAPGKSIPPSHPDDGKRFTIRVSPAGSGLGGVGQTSHDLTVQYGADRIGVKKLRLNCVNGMGVLLANEVPYKLPEARDCGFLLKRNGTFACTTTLKFDTERRTVTRVPTLTLNDSSQCQDVSADTAGKREPNMSDSTDENMGTAARNARQRVQDRLTGR